MDHRKKNQTSWTDSDMTQMWELPDKEYKITMINVLKTLMEKKIDTYTIRDFERRGTGI